MPRKKPAPTLTPSQRRDELRLLLRGGWQSLAAIMERLQISRITAWRRLREIEATEPLESYEDGGFRFWRLPASSREHPLHITTAEMIALAFVRNSLSFLAGTGIKEDLDALIDRFSHVLKAHDYAHWKNIDRKLFDVNEGAYRYDKIDVVNDLVTALLHECRVTCALRDGTQVKVDPYSLVLYKKGLYLVGFSHKRGEIRKWALDKIEDVTRHPGEPFAYPPGFDPGRYMSGPLGIIRGPLVDASSSASTRRWSTSSRGAAGMRRRRSVRARAAGRR